MAGVATAYSTEDLPSGGVDNEKWEFSVPIGSDVGFHPIQTLFLCFLLPPLSGGACEVKRRRRKGKTNHPRTLLTDLLLSHRALPSIPQNHGPPMTRAPSVRDRLGIETPTAHEARLSPEPCPETMPLIMHTAADETTV
jgi:hypothetical protein